MKNSGWAVTCSHIALAGAALVGWTLLPCGGAIGQTLTVDFSEIYWPASPTGLIDGEGFFSPDGLDLYNASGNSLFFDAQYQVVGNGSHITGEALWGNPLDLNSGYVGLDFCSLGAGDCTGVSDLSFDFAWSESFVLGAPDELTFYAEDSEGRSTFIGLPLTGTFPGLGGSNGYEDNLHLSISFLNDDNQDIDGGPFIDIAYLEIYVSDIAFGGNQSEFAIDNLVVNGGGGGGELDPENSFLVTTLGIGTNRLRTTNPGSSGFGFQFDVQNLDFGGTTFTVTLDPTSDPEFTPGTPAVAQRIGGNQTLNSGSGLVATIDTSVPSGEYQASATTSNDLNPLDPDDATTYTITILDPPELTANNQVPVQAAVSPNLTLENAVAGPHAGAQRASAEVTAATVSGAGLTVTGYEVGQAVAAGETRMGMVAFDRFGRLSGSYPGTVTIALKMTDPNRNFLNGATPLSDVEWEVQFELADQLADSAAVEVSESYHRRVGVNNAQTAATLIDGTASTHQDVGLAVVANPESADATTSAMLATHPVELSFSVAGDLYVLQLTYTETGLPGAEEDLAWLTFDEAVGDWVDALALNSDGGAGASSHPGSYVEFLAAAGGGVLDAADLGAHGIDAVNNQAWAVLDHASLFAIGRLATGQGGDFDQDGDVDGADFLAWQRGELSDPPSAGDLAVWEANFATFPAAHPAAHSAASVPEPATLLLAIVGLVVGRCPQGRHLLPKSLLKFRPTLNTQR
jgi:hypothetical protein